MREIIKDPTARVTPPILTRNSYHEHKVFINYTNRDYFLKGRFLVPVKKEPDLKNAPLKYRGCVVIQEHLHIPLESLESDLDMYRLLIEKGVLIGNHRRVFTSILDSFKISQTDEERENASSVMTAQGCKIIKLETIIPEEDLEEAAMLKEDVYLPQHDILLLTDLKERDIRRELPGTRKDLYHFTGIYVASGDDKTYYTTIYGRVVQIPSQPRKGEKAIVRIREYDYNHTIGSYIYDCMEYPLEVALKLGIVYTEYAPAKSVTEKIKELSKIDYEDWEKQRLLDLKTACPQTTITKPHPPPDKVKNTVSLMASLSKMVSSFLSLGKLIITFFKN